MVTVFVMVNYWRIFTLIAHSCWMKRGDWKHALQHWKKNLKRNRVILRFSWTEPAKPKSPLSNSQQVHITVKKLEIILRYTCVCALSDGKIILFS